MGERSVWEKLGLLLAAVFVACVLVMLALALLADYEYRQGVSF